MQIFGKIIAALPVASGIGKSTGNQWRKQEFVLETIETYPKKMCFQLFGEKIDQFPVEVGQCYTVSFDINAREYNGRWFNSIDAWKVELGQTVSAAPATAAQPAVTNPAVPQTPYPGTPAPQAQQQVAPPPAQNLPNAGAPAADDDLPF